MFSLKGEGEGLFPTIIPCMGGFHISMCMLHTIYIFLKRCGMLQLLSSADLGGLGTVKKALSSGGVKEGINLIKSCMRHFYIQKLNVLMYLNMKPSKK